MARFSMGRFSMVRCGMVWCGTVWYGMVWYSLVCVCCSFGAEGVVFRTHVGPQKYALTVALPKAWVGVVGLGLILMH